MRITERLRHRLELRRSNAAQPHRNHYRERKTGQDNSCYWLDQDGADWLTEYESETDVLEPGELEGL